MASESYGALPEPAADVSGDGDAGSLSKKAAKKAALKAEKQLRQQLAAAALASTVEEDPLAGNYGDVPLQELQSKAITGRVWTPVSELVAVWKGRTVLIRGRAQSIRKKGGIVFFIVREAGYTVQCVLSKGEHASKGMVNFAGGISKESIVDVQGVVSVPDTAIAATSQQVRVLPTTVLPERQYLSGWLKAARTFWFGRLRFRYVKSSASARRNRPSPSTLKMQQGVTVILRKQRRYCFADYG